MLVFNQHTILQILISQKLIKEELKANPCHVQIKKSVRHCRRQKIRTYAMKHHKHKRNSHIKPKFSELSLTKVITRPFCRGLGRHLIFWRVMDIPNERIFFPMQKLNCSCAGRSYSRTITFNSSYWGHKRPHMLKIRIICYLTAISTQHNLHRSVDISSKWFDKVGFHDT